MVVSMSRTIAIGAVAAIACGWLALSSSVVHARAARQERNPNCTGSLQQIVLHYGMSEVEHRKKVARIEKYLWSHWEEKKGGCSTVRFATLEGDVVDTNIYLEPDMQGVWRVRIERRGNRAFRGKPNQRFVSRVTYFAYSVVRADEHQFSLGRTLEIPDSEDLAAGDFVLLFKGKEGEIIYNLEPSNVYN
jgi:hypothetical protein